MNLKIMIIDDEEDLLENYCRLLRPLQCRVVTYKDSVAALQALPGECPDLVITDLKMPHKDGMEVLREVKAFDREIVVLLFTAYATIESAVNAVKNGAFDYIPKPFSAEQLRIIVTRALEQKKLRAENKQLRQQLQGSSQQLMIGNSTELIKVKELAERAARTDANVLILGESGTGKELLARFIHAHSTRAERDFVPLDCAALPANLLESELFGHEKGAFTGAYGPKKGLLEAAHGGTLFLDEVGELQHDIQAKFLRVLEERKFRPIGSMIFKEADVRLISATNRKLEKMVVEEKFRQDLFYRLNVICLEMPPLRHRLEDVPLLAGFFLQRYNLAQEKEIRLSAEALKVLKYYSWPGNIRELRNVLERAVSLAQGDVIFPQDLFLQDQQSDGASDEEAAGKPYHQAKEEMLADFEHQYLNQLLNCHGGNISAAARESGLNRRTIHRLLAKHGL